MNTWEEMKHVDVQTVDINSLVDIREVTIQQEMPKEQRISDYIKQIGNPYCFRYKDAVIKLKFGQEKMTLETGLENYAERL